MKRKSIYSMIFCCLFLCSCSFTQGSNGSGGSVPDPQKEKNVYNVSFVGKDSYFGTKQVNEGDVIGTPITPNYPGEVLKYWTFEGNKVDDSFFSTYKVFSDIEIFGVMETTVHNVKISINDPFYGYFSCRESDKTGDLTELELKDVPFGTRLTLHALGNNHDGSFVNWTDNGKEVKNEAYLEYTVESDVNLVANFVKNTEGVTLTFLNYDGTLLAKNRFIPNEGYKVDYRGIEPIKEKNVSESMDGKFRNHVTEYEFIGWDNKEENPQVDTTYIAQYQEVEYDGYRVQFFDDDNTLLETQYIKENEEAVFSQETLFKFDAEYGYVFSKWDVDKEDLQNVTERLNPKAIYIKVPRRMLGEYPQSVVLDKELTERLDQVKEVDEKGYKTLDGEKYYRYGNASYTNLNFEFVGDNAHYYKVEPIAWSKLSLVDNTVVLITTRIIDAPSYAYHNNKYDTSDFRKFLNEDFLLTAFDNTDFILETEVVNDEESTLQVPNPNACENTFDKVYALSCKEVKKYLGNRGQAYMTDYTQALFCPNGRSMARYTNDSAMHLGCYLTRSPHPNNDKYVFTYFKSYNFDFCEIYPGAGARPVMKIDLTK